jgi:hypothetical protein
MRASPAPLELQSVDCRRRCPILSQLEMVKIAAVVPLDFLASLWKNAAQLVNGGTVTPPSGLSHPVQLP